MILDNSLEILRWISQESCGGTDCHFFAYSIIFIASINPNPWSLLTEIKKKPNSYEVVKGERTGSFSLGGDTSFIVAS